MNIRLRPLPWLLCGLLTLATPALACPVCDEATGRRVRAGLFDEDLGLNLLAAALPFVVFLGIAALLHFGLPFGRGVAPGPTDSRR